MQVCDEVWDDTRMRNSSLDGSAKRAETFRVEQDRGEERQGGGELVREVCQQKEMAWMIQLKPRDTQRPWVHLAPAEGSVPFLQRAPVREGSCRIGCRFGRRHSNWGESLPKVFCKAWRQA